MADLTQTLTARLEVDLGNWEASLKRAGQAAQDVAKATEKAGQAAQRGAEQGAKAQGKAADQAEKAGRKAKAAGDDSAKGSDKAKTGAEKAGTAQEKLGQKASQAGDKAKAASQKSKVGSEQAASAAKAAGAAHDAAATKAQTAWARATTGMKAGVSKVTSLTDQQLSAVSDVSTSALRAGAALTATSVLGVKAAMDWESAWTGVTKTVDGTPEQMAEVEAGLRGLAKTLPSTHQEIAAVAENAGQLGVARKDIVGFTKTMVDLGETTNLTADDAATNIAQISNVMGTMSRDGSEGVSRFGATLVALGNDGASTESEILSMAQRMAGAVKTLGGSESDLLALSNTLASMGVRSELGGGVATRVLLKMRTAVDEGGDSLQAFADVAGTSAQDFATKFKSSPMEALDLVAKGINRVNTEGGNVTATLKSMGLKGTEETQVMLALANSGDLLADSLKLGNQAWQDNSALTDEATKRYDTAASKVKVAWNKIKDAAISAGEALAPAVGTVADIVGGIADAFNGLPGPVKTALSSLTGFAGVGLLVAGGLGKAVGAVNNLTTAAANLTGIVPGLSGKLSGLSKTAGGVGAALGGIAATFSLIKAAAGTDLDRIGGLENFSREILGAGDNTDVLKGKMDELARSSGTSVLSISGIGDAIKNLDMGGEAVGEWFLSLGGLTDNRWKLAKKSVEDLDGSLSALVQNGKVEEAQRAFKVAADEAQRVGETDLSQIQAAFPQMIGSLRDYAQGLNVSISEADAFNWAMSGVKPAAVEAAEGARDAASGLDSLANGASNAGSASSDAAAASKELTDALAEVGLAADGSVQDIQKFLDVLFSAGNANMEARDAAANYAEQLRNVDKTAKEIANGKLKGGLTDNKKDFDLASEAGARLNAEYSALAQKGMADVIAQSKVAGTTQKDVQKGLKDNYDDLVAKAKKFGIEGKGAAEAVAKEYLGIPKEVKIESWVEDTAQATFEKIKAAQEGVAPEVDTKVNVKPGKNEAEAWRKREIEKDAAFNVNAEPGQDKATGWMGVITGAKSALVDADPGKDGTKSWFAGIKSPKDTPFNAVQGSNSASPFLDPIGAPRNAPMNAVMGSDSATGRLNAIAAPRSVGINAFFTGVAAGAAAAVGGKANGGRLPGHADGYRLPTTGPGTDKVDGFLGVNHKGMPLARVDAGEWIINGKSSQKYNGLLAAINQDSPAVQGLAALASGGRVGWSSKDQAKSKAGAAKATSKRKTAAAKVRAEEKDVNAAQKAYDKIDSTKKNKSKKASARANLKKQKAQLKAAEKKLAAAEKAEQKAKDAYQDDRERTTRLRELEFDTRRDLYRGDIRDNYGAGNYAGVDALFEQSNNKDLSKNQRSNLRKLAYAQEKQTKALTNKQGMLEKRLDSAQSKFDELSGVRDGVKSQISGAFDMKSLIGQKDSLGYDKKLTKSSLMSYGKKLASGARTLSSKVKELQKRGFPASMLQHVIDEWSDSQTFELADAMLAMNKKERGTFTGYFKSVESYGNTTGKTVTLSMYKGGVDAAQGLVKGVESQLKMVEKSFAKMGTAGEKAFKKALGIKSPSRVLKAAGVWAGKGAALGVRESIPENEQAMRDLAMAQAAAYQPQYRLPASAEVQAHAVSQGASAYVTRDELMAVVTTLAERPIRNTVEIGGRAVSRAVQDANRWINSNR